MVVAVLAAVVAGLGYVAVFRSPGAPSRAVVAPAAPSTVMLDEEVRRLSRSAIVAARR